MQVAYKALAVVHLCSSLCNCVCPCFALSPVAQDFGLHKFAAGFADVGLAAFVFDYRGWGGSGGVLGSTYSMIWVYQIAHAVVAC